MTLKYLLAVVYREGLQLVEVNDLKKNRDSSGYGHMGFTPAEPCFLIGTGGDYSVFLEHFKDALEEYSLTPENIESIVEAGEENQIVTYQDAPNPDDQQIGLVQHKMTRKEAICRGLREIRDDLCEPHDYWVGQVEGCPGNLLQLVSIYCLTC